ncbi:MAG: Stf0 family sulfotransferase [Cyanobacteria bacterium J06648_16]
MLPKKSILICSTGRSGSTMLCSLLSRTNHLGYPYEFFHSQRLARANVDFTAEGIHDYLAELFKSTLSQNGIFSIKLHWDQMRALIKQVRMDEPWQDKSDLDILKQLFPNPVFLFIRRRSLTRQAISMEVAKQTGKYVRWQKKDGQEDETYLSQRMMFRPLNIYRYKQGLAARNLLWQSFFEKHDLDFFEVVYEQLISDYEGTMNDLIDFVDINADDETFEFSPLTKKQGNKLNERWFNYYNFIPESVLATYSLLRAQARKMIASS